MKKYKKVYKLITLCVFLAIGVMFTIGHSKHQDITELSHNHPAYKMYYEGYWEGRYQENWARGGDVVNTNGMYLSINVRKDMTKEEMVSILDYFELVANAEYMGTKYVGEKDCDFVAYAVFFRGDTDEELARIKFMNGKEAGLTEEWEDKLFPQPYLRAEPGENIGPWF